MALISTRLLAGSHSTTAAALTALSKLTASRCVQVSLSPSTVLPSSSKSSDPHLDCVSDIMCLVAGAASGDPHFVGYDGQRCQI